MSDKNYEKFIPNDLTPDHILYKSLDMVVCDKLIKDKYYCVKNIITDIGNDYMNKVCNKKTSENEKIFKNGIQTQNTLENLEDIFEKLNMDEPTFEYALCVIYLYLNQQTKKEEEEKETKKETKERDYKKVISKKILGDFICETLEKLDLIKKDEYQKYNKDFIIKKDSEILINEFKDLTDFTKFIKEIANNNNNNNELFFRGHSNTNFMATPTLFRDNYYKNEYEMFHELVIRCQENFYNCRYRFEYISLMQHYGLPTRLLDVTLNPLVALYFACENCSSDVAEVLVYKVPKDEIKHSKGDTVSILSNLSMFKFEEQKKIYQKDTTSLQNLINQINVEKPYFNESIISKKILNEPLFIIPERDNRRIINQKGAFVLFGLNNELYGDSNNNNDSNNYKFLEHRVERILYINSNNKKDIMDELKLFGIDKSFIYPEIDNVAEDIKNQYGQR